MRLAFGEPFAKLIATTELDSAQWLPTGWRQQRTLSKHSVQPTVDKIPQAGKIDSHRSIAISTLRKLREEIRIQASHSLIAISDSNFFNRHAGRIQMQANDEISRIDEAIRLLKRGVS